MEKNDISDNEEISPEIVESVPLPKPKRKITLSEEERKRRGDNLRNIVAKRKAENDKVNEVVKEDVMAVKKQTIKKISKLKMEKALALAHPESDSDSDSSVELPSSKKKRKSKANQPIIIIKNYHHDKKKEYDATENIAKLQEMYKPEPEPVPQQVRLGYFV